MKKGCIYMLVSPFIMVVALIAATMGGYLYSEIIQKRTCFNYALEKRVPELEYLEFTEVTIVSNHFHGHNCIFKDIRTGAPVILTFDDEDIPYTSDGLQVTSMFVPFLCFGMVGAVALDWAITKFGIIDNSNSQS